jgi:hypothetical protein
MPAEKESSDRLPAPSASAAALGLAAKFLRNLTGEHDAARDDAGLKALGLRAAQDTCGRIGFAPADTDLIAGELRLLSLEGEQADASGVAAHAGRLPNPGLRTVGLELTQRRLPLVDALLTVVDAAE